MELTCAADWKNLIHNGRFPMKGLSLAWKLQKGKIDSSLKSNEGESMKWMSCSAPS